MLKLTKKKLIITGSIIEAYDYIDKSLAYGFTVSTHNKARRKIVVIDEESKLRKLEARKRSMRRAGSRIRKLVNANAWQWKISKGTPYTPIFLTLTFRDDIRDIKKANAYFSYFIRRLNYMVFSGSKKCALKYVAVIEFQDLNRGGVVHYHAIFFNLLSDYTKSISEVWSYGFVDKKNIDKIGNLGNYLSKSLFSSGNDGRLDKCKHYFSSRGLLQPIEIREQDKAQTIIELIPKEYIIKEDTSEGYQGTVKTVSYKLNNDENLFNILPELNNLL